MITPPTRQTWKNQTWKWKPFDESDSERRDIDADFVAHIRGALSSFNPDNPDRSDLKLILVQAGYRLDDLSKLTMADVRQACVSTPVKLLQRQWGGPNNTNETSSYASDPGPPAEADRTPGMTTLQTTPTTYAPSEIVDKTGMSGDTINRYAKLADVRTPGVGQRNHRYTADEYAKILRCTIEKTSDSKQRQSCTIALNGLQGNPPEIRSKSANQK